MILIINNSLKETSQVLGEITQDLKRENLPYQIISLDNLKVSSFNKVNLIITLGGDGTILFTFSKMPDKSVPLLAIDFGTVGFMSSVNSSHALKLIKNYIEINFKNKSVTPLYKFDERYYLKATLGQKSISALNEITLQRTGTKIIKTEIWINDKFISRFKGDGLILATATGSTAYNLSAGGPIINPNIPNIILTPLAPHSITFKPILLKSSDKITIKIPLKNSRVAVDGKYQNSTKSKEIKATISTNTTKLIKEKNEDFYSLLKKKFSWGIK